MKADLNLVILFVSNPQTASRFYQDLLGLEPVERSPTFALFVLPNGMRLGLWSQHTAEPHVKGSAGLTEICFPCEDPDGLYEQWSSKELIILQKPTDMDFGRTFVVEGPDGHRLRLYRLSEAA